MNQDFFLYRFRKQERELILLAELIGYSLYFDGK